MPDPGPLAGEPRDRKYPQPRLARAGTWLVWWVLLMSLWVMLDDSLATDELLAGAGAAALAALGAELATYQAATRFRMRIRWLVPALRLPGQVVRDTVIVYAALWRRLARGEQPDSAFVTEPVRFGDDTPGGVTRRGPADRGTERRAKRVRARHRPRHRNDGPTPAGGQGGRLTWPWPSPPRRSRC